VRLPPLEPGHTLQLLEGSAQLFPALIEAFDQARHEIWLETYIFDFNGSSAQVAAALERAAARGVAVRIVVDGFGTPETPDDWHQRFRKAGVHWQVYAPVGSLGVLWPGSWRRLHRKLCVVDRTVAFCGGINVMDDLYDPNHGALDFPRLDFAVRIGGPMVQDIWQAASILWQRLRALHRLDPRAIGEVLLHPMPRPPAPPPGDRSDAARAALLLRDNLRHRAHIERAYLRAIGRAQSEIIIANAYFVPGGRLRRALAGAARRGVRVTLLLQGKYEYFMQYYASRPVYDALLKAGVSIHEYSPSFLHAKVGVFDARLATVGSSNLDPLSLLLAREANVMVDDAAFAGALRERLLLAITHHGEEMDPVRYARRPLREWLLERLALGVMRLALIVQGKKYL
jgi:cardiolipin synthase